MISPVDYGMVEQIYEGNTWMMAVELGVTIQVLSDYRQLLYDSGVCVHKRSSASTYRDGNKKGYRPNTVGRNPRNQQSAFPFSPK